MPARTITAPCQTFAQLKRAVQETFLEGQRRADELRVRTTKPDKYDRYLAVVFFTVFGSSSGGARTAESEEIFLNNALLENGHARRTDVYAPGDWGEA
ncbi:MAG: thermonuclease family protein [Verrucomicrobia bacterium]|nr:thermonuclease family protein [Verrucomicrobiota bacterium]